MSLTGDVLLTDQVQRAQEDFYHPRQAKAGFEAMYAQSGTAAFDALLGHSEVDAAFIIRTVLLISFIFGLIFAYSRSHETIQAKTGLKLAHVCCIVYATLSIAIDLSIKNAAVAYGGSFPMNPACSVVVVEYCKLVVSAVLFAVYVADSRANGREVSTPRAQDIGWLSVPAAIYAVNNLLVFQAIKSTPLSTFGVVRETMLIWNALIWCATFNQSICLVRWMAIGGIFFGCAANQIPKMLNDELTFGVLWAFALALSNAAGAVANEYAMKKRAQLDINLQNSILYGLCGTFVLIGIAVFDTPTVSSASTFFHGFVPECWQVIILQTFTGLAVSRILKYVEAVTKTIVAAIRGPGVIFFGALVFHTTLGLSEVIATLIVCASCYIYLVQGPLIKPVEASPKKDALETDKLLPAGQKLAEGKV